MTVSEQSILKSFKLLSTDAKGNFPCDSCTFMFITDHLSKNFVCAACSSHDT